MEQRIAALEARLARLEDEAAILRLIAAYGPAVDSCDAAAVAALWAEDGSYDFGGAPLQGSAAVGALVDLDSHRGYVAAGAGHVLSLPRVTIDGDRAVAVNYSQVLVRDRAGGWRCERLSANRWDLGRGPAGWQVVARVNRLLDGAEAPRALLAAAAAPPDRNDDGRR
jgi:ketosteroid isomerase-like protein